MKLGGYRRSGNSSLGVTARQAGFTVVETMIVLAVTAMIFVGAVIIISGKQNRTQFVTAINGLQQQMQQLISETANGYFPQDTAFSCTRGSSAPPVLTTQVVTDRQGQNPGCIFLGKVVQFGVKNSNPQTFEVFPIIGNRMDTFGVNEASTLYGTTGAYPIAAAPGTTATTNSNLTTAALENILPQGLRVVNMWYGNDVANTSGAVGFISTLPTTDGVGVSSGSQQLALYTVAGSALGKTPAEMVDYIYPGMYNSTPLTAVTTISICVASGTTDQSGLITIGQSDSSASSSLSVTLAIKPGQAC